MNLGERLIELRKASHLSQEEVAFKLNVTRQTVSKWETNQSTPDFDKIGPLCDLFLIDPNELINGIKKEVNNKNVYSKEKRTKGIVIGILLYFVAVAWIIISIPYLMINPIASSAIFILICGIATCMIIYTSMVYKKEEKKEEKQDDKLSKQIESIVSLIFTIVYLYISFKTMMWHITWIIWIIYALVIEIIKLFISLRGDKDE